MRGERILRRLVAELEYDFRYFSVESFVGHVERYQRREIVVMGTPMAVELSAMLVRAQSADYIFYNTDLHPLLQVHSVLHELGHIVLRHPGKPLEEVLPPEMLQQMPSSTKGHLRMTDAQLRDTPEEREAEAFALLVQKHRIEARERAKRAEPCTSIPALRPWVDGIWNVN